jgi:hypothetical protein
MSSKTLVDVLAEMEITPRERLWSSLSYCVIDAVWSISAQYDAVATRRSRWLRGGGVGGLGEHTGVTEHQDVDV